MEQTKEEKEEEEENEEEEEEEEEAEEGQTKGGNGIKRKKTEFWIERKSIKKKNKKGKTKSLIKRNHLENKEELSEKS